MPLKLLVIAGISSGLFLLLATAILSRLMDGLQGDGLLKKWCDETASDVRWFGRIQSPLLALYIIFGKSYPWAGRIIYVLSYWGGLLFLLLCCIAFIEQGYQHLRKMISASRMSARDKTNLLTLIPLAASGVKYIAYFTFAVSALGVAGVNILPVLGVSAIALGAIAVASQHILQDIIATLTIFTDRLYGHGSVIKLPGQQTGTVDRVTWRWTFIRQEGKMLVVANRKIELFWLEEEEE